MITKAARNMLLALFALAVVGLTPPAHAQQQQQPSPAALLLAKQIVELKGVRALFAPMVRGVIEKAKTVFMQTNFMLAKDLNEIAVNLHKEYDDRTAEVVDQTARIYASHFTEQELKDILNFYKSPVGRKMIVEEPKALDESMNAAATWANSLSDDVMAKFRAEMKKRGHDL